LSSANRAIAYWSGIHHSPNAGPVAEAGAVEEAIEGVDGARASPSSGRGRSEGFVAARAKEVEQRRRPVVSSRCGEAGR